MILYEQEPIDGKWQTAKGQVCWFTEEDVKKDAPHFVYLFHEKLEDKSKLLPLKAALIESRKNTGVNYWTPEETFYRYTLSNSGKLKTFGINYREIK